VSDQQLMSLFHRAADSLEPDVVRLVEAGTTRGRLQRRRRAAGIALAVACTAGAVATTGLLLPHGGGADTVAAHPTAQVRRVAVAPSQMGETLARLLPGARPVDDHAPYQNEVQRGVVNWHGVEVSLSIDSRSVGTKDTARERCEAFLDDACTEAPGGGWFAEYGTMQSAGDGRPETNFNAIQLYASDGYVIEALEESGPAQEVDQSLGQDDVLLRRLVLDHTWLR
jgi:hypothetical protein